MQIQRHMAGLDQPEPGGVAAVLEEPVPGRELDVTGSDAAVWPWPGGDRDVYVRIIPGTITGRRVESR